MNQKTRNTTLTVIGAILAVVVTGAVIFLSYVRSVTAPVPMTLTYATVQTNMPEGAICAGKGDSPTIAKEILNLESHDIFVAGGTNPMPDEVWTNYSFRLPLMKNSTRRLLFTGSCFFRSPGASATCQGDDCLKVQTVVDYTWLKLTTIVGQSCFPDASGCNSDVVNPGYISINTIAKCQRIVFDGPVIYELADGKGNKYVMHATGTGTPDTKNPNLPQGWTLTERTITTPLVLLPFGGGNDCYYNVIRDNLVQSYHQYMYAGNRYPAQIEPNP